MTIKAGLVNRFSGNLTDSSVKLVSAGNSVGAVEVATGATRSFLPALANAEDLVTRARAALRIVQVSRDSITIEAPVDQANAAAIGGTDTGFGKSKSGGKFARSLGDKATIVDTLSTSTAQSSSFVVVIGTVLEAAAWAKPSYTSVYKVLPVFTGTLCEHSASKASGSEKSLGDHRRRNVSF